MGEVGQALQEIWKGRLQLGNEGKLDFQVGDAGLERVDQGGPEAYMQGIPRNFGLGGKVQLEELGGLRALGHRDEGILQGGRLEQAG